MKQKKSVMYIFLEGAAALAVLLMVGIFPLYYQDNYIDMSNAKLNFFRICAVGLILAFILFSCMDRLMQYKESMQQKNKKHKKKMPSKGQEQVQIEKGEALKQWLGGISATTWFAVIFAAGILIATVFSANPQESWQGLEGRKLGALVWLLCIAMYLILGKYLKLGKWTAWVFLAANMIVCLLASLNFWGVDPLKMYENLAADQYGSFISTIGNVNACSSYLCMTAPAGMALYVVTKDKYLRAVSGVYLILAFYAGYCSHSESFLLGIGVSFLVLLWFSLCNHERMLRFLEVCGFLWIAGVVMKVMILIAGSKDFSNYMYVTLITNKFQYGLLLNGYLLAAEGILLAGVLFLVWNRKKSGKELSYNLIRKIIFIAVAAAAVIVIAAIAAANLKQSAWEGSLSALERLRLQDSWGSGRGYIWRITVESWLASPLWDKITGYGVNYYHMFIQQYGGTAVSEYFGGALLVDAHNELLQILTTMGVVGTVGYFGLLISTAVKSAKRISVKPSVLLGVILVCSYMAQGLVNNPTVFLTPYLFLLLGMIKSMEKAEDVGE